MSRPSEAEFTWCGASDKYQLAQGGLYWIFRDDTWTHLLQLPHRKTTNFEDDLSRLAFHPDPLLLRNHANMPRWAAVPRAARDHQEGPIPEFSATPDIPMHNHGDFQRVLFYALHAIWVRVSRCRCWRCTSRRSVRARPLSAAGPSHQHHDDSVDATDKDTDED